MQRSLLFRTQFNQSARRKSSALEMLLALMPVEEVQKLMPWMQQLSAMTMRRDGNDKFSMVVYHRRRRGRFSLSYGRHLRTLSYCLKQQ